MQIKLFQLNIWFGKFLPAIVEYVKEHDFDILTFQEVVSPYFKLWLSGENETECREYLREHLPEYEAVFFKTTGYVQDHASYMGQLTLYKRKFALKSSVFTWMKDMKLYDRDVQADAAEIPLLPRGCGWVELEYDGKVFWVGNVHGPWGADGGVDNPEKLRQGEVLTGAIERIQAPWILAGDMNMPPETAVMRKLSSLGHNLTSENRVRNTLNPQTSYAYKIFQAQEGTAVDYVLHNKDFSAHDFSVVRTPTLSDHYGLRATLFLKEQ